MRLWFIFLFVDHPEHASLPVLTWKPYIAWDHSTFSTALSCDKMPSFWNQHLRPFSGCSYHLQSSERWPGWGSFHWWHPKVECCLCSRQPWVVVPLISFRHKIKTLSPCFCWLIYALLLRSYQCFLFFHSWFIVSSCFYCFDSFKYDVIVCYGVPFLVVKRLKTFVNE